MNKPLTFMRAMWRNSCAMNYHHAFHAGSFADVIKHIVLARIITYLQDKPGRSASSTPMPAPASTISTATRRAGAANG